MNHLPRRPAPYSRCAAAAALLLFVAAAPVSAWAQPTRGFDQIAPAKARQQELNRQNDLWVLEVHLKPMRLVWIDREGADAEQDRSKEPIWYLVYRAANRELQPSGDESDTTPVNTLDPVPQKPLFIPELTVVTYDDPETQIPLQIIRDEVIPPALVEINRIEAHRPDDPLLKDSVTVTQPIADPVPEGEEAEWIYGVATWRGINPDTDFFKVILGGFSNGYEERTGPDGKPVIWRKVLVQEFIRRGDRYDLNQAEFQFAGPPRWEYQPEVEPVVEPLGVEASRTPETRR